MKLLFVTSTRVGDAVLSTGVLDQLLIQHPGAEVTIACGGVATSLFGAVPGLQRILPIRKQRWGRHWWRLWRDTVATRWDLVVDLRGSALAFLLPARRRIVWRTPPGDAHRVRQLGQVLNLTVPPAPRLWTTAAQDAAAAQLVPDGGPVLAVGPTANWRGKQWPIDRFIALVDRLTAPGGILPGARVAVFAAPFERSGAAPLLDHLPDDRRIDAIDAGDLALVGAALRRTALYVGNDSGLMHLAAAAGTPTLGLFGPSPDHHYAPWGTCTAVARTIEGHAELFARAVADPEHPDGLMDSLSVEMAEATALTLWRKCGERPA